MLNKDSLTVLSACVLVAAGIGGCMWGLPKYKVYKQEMAGRAVLAEAESSRQVATLEAKAKNESAVFLNEATITKAKGEAQAEIERARGVAEANKIIGESLRNNEQYLRYLYVTSLAGSDHQIIYVPTEANLPILEATRLK